MKKKLLILKIAFLLGLITASMFGQTTVVTTTDSLQGFNEQKEKDFFLQSHPHNHEHYNEFISSKKRDYVFTNFYAPNRLIQSPSSVQTACTNMDFESGDLTGWATSTGYHPLYNAQGCCTAAGGAQQVMSGTGNDPCGGFPLVAPGGNFSVRLGDNNVNGVADRLEQTFSVTQANANYTYRYAVVLEEPGHTATEQPSFQIEMLDNSGVQIPCTFYQVSAGQGIPGFLNSANCNGAIYKPWTTVSVDLSAYVGQDVTIRFTTYDCSLGGHYAYAYIDGSCVSYGITQNDSLCVGGVTDICAPPGFQTYTWAGPGIVGQNGNCATVNAPGNYSVQLTTVTGCSTPLINYVVNNYPTPVAQFGVVGGSNACSLNVLFNNTSSVNGNNQMNYLWDFGDGTASFMEQPMHTYLADGTYTVTLIATVASTGCSDTTTQVITIDIPPTPQFVTGGVCVGTVVNFTNQTPGLLGGEMWLWNFGDNATATSMNTNHIYAIAGNYNISLTITNANGCSGTANYPVTIAPVPTAAFVSTTVCVTQPTSFTSNSTVPTGSIVSWAWDFNSDGITDNTLTNPTYTFPAAGNNNVRLAVTTNAGCVSSVINAASVSPNPIAAFITNNVCANAFAVFQNTSSVALPSQINQYAWDFGDNTTESVLNPTHQYAIAGTYQVSLGIATNDGCSNTYSFPIIVHPLPLTNFASTTECHTQATQFSDQTTVPGGGMIVSRVWDFNNDGITDASGFTNPAFTYSNAGMFNAKLETTTNNGCYNQVVSQVVVHNNPVAFFSGATQCLGNTTNFSNVSSSVDGVISSFNWDFTTDGTVDNIASSPTYNYPSFGTYLVTLQIQTEYGCEASYSSTVRINPNPGVQFSAPSASACPTMCVSFTNQTTIASGSIATYTWDFGDGNTEENALGNHCYGSGNYNVSLTAVSDQGCTTSVSKPNLINVFPSPTAGFDLSLQEDEELSVINPEVGIKNTAIGASTLNYLVSNGYSTQNADFTYVFNSEVAQTYSITQIVTNIYGCRDSIEKTVEIKPAFTFYIPNAFSPNDDGMNDGFKGEGMGIDEYKMWIYDRWGNMIFFSEELGKVWDGTVQGKSGTLVLQDIYIYKVQLTDVFNKKHNYHGTVDVVR